MGNHYTNVTVKGPDQKAIVEYLRAEGLRAWVSPTVGGCTVVFDRNMMEAAWDEEMGDDDHGPLEVGPRLSLAFSCPSLEVMVADDDVLSVQLCRDGRVVGDYVSNPGYGQESVGAPEGGDARELCEAFGAGDGAIDRVEVILREPGVGADDSPSADGYVFETDRHGDLVRALGLPDWAVGTGYNYIQQGEPPDGFDPATWVHVGA